MPAHASTGRVRLFLVFVAALLLVVAGLAVRGAPVVRAQDATPAAVSGSGTASEAIAQPTVCPDPEDIPLPPVNQRIYYDYALLVDISGSMAGWDNGVQNLNDNIFPLVQESAKDFVTALPDDSMVLIIPFSDGVDPAAVREFFTGTPSGPDGGREDALAYIDSLVADGNLTHITDAVDVALQRLEALIADDTNPHAQTILIWTDGEGNGTNDLDENGQPTFENVGKIVREYKERHPYLFGYYVAIGVDPKNTQPLEDEGWVIDRAPRGDKLPLREVRVALVKPDLGVLRPGKPTTNLLCIASGDGEGVTVGLTGDGTKLPDGVTLRPEASGGRLSKEGISVTWTLGGNAEAYPGEMLTGGLAVSTADRGVIVLPPVLDATVTVPTVNSLSIPSAASPASLAKVDIVRDKSRTEPVVWDVPIDYTLGKGGELTLSIDRSRTGEFPNAKIGFKIGQGGEVTPDLALKQNGKDALLHIELPIADALALADGDHEIAFDVVADPGSGVLDSPQAVERPDGTSVIGVAAPFRMIPAPEVMITSVAPTPQPQTVSLGANPINAAPVTWDKTVVTYETLGGATGTLALDATKLTEVFPNATAAFVLDDGSPADTVDLAPGKHQATIAVSVPNEDARTAGLGSHGGDVALVVDALDAVFTSDLPFVNGADGTHRLPLAYSVGVVEGPQLPCRTPSFAETRIWVDATDPVKISAALECQGITGTTATAEITGPDGAHFVDASGDAIQRVVTLGEQAPTAKIVVEVPAANLVKDGPGERTVPVTLTITASANDAVLSIDGKQQAGPGPHEVRAGAKVVVVPRPRVLINSVPLGEQTVLTTDDPARSVEWTADLPFTVENGATATFAASLVDKQAANATVTVKGVADPLAERVSLKVPAGDGQALGSGEHELCLDLTVKPGPDGAVVVADGAAGAVGSPASLTLCGKVIVREPPTVIVTLGPIPAPAPVLNRSALPDVVALPPVPVTVTTAGGAAEPSLVVENADPTHPGATGSIANGGLAISLPAKDVGEAAEQCVQLSIRVAGPQATVVVKPETIGVARQEGQDWVISEGEPKWFCFSVVTSRVDLTIPSPEIAVDGSTASASGPLHVTWEVAAKADPAPANPALGSPASDGIPGVPASGLAIAGAGGGAPGTVGVDSAPWAVVSADLRSEDIAKLKDGTYDLAARVQVDPAGACVAVNGATDCQSTPFTVPLTAKVTVSRPVVDLTVCKRLEPDPAKVKVNDEKDTRLVVLTCEISADLPSGGSPSFTLNVEPVKDTTGDKRAEDLLPKQAGFRLPGGPADAPLQPSVTLSKDAPKAVAEVQFDRQALRAFGEGTYDLKATLGVDPDGANVKVEGGHENQVAGEVKIYKPIPWWVYAAAVAALGTVAAAWFGRPRLPATLTEINSGAPYQLGAARCANIGGNFDPVPLGYPITAATLCGGWFGHGKVTVPPNGSGAGAAVTVGAIPVPPGSSVPYANGNIIGVDGFQLM